MLSRRPLVILVVSALLGLAACGSSAGASPPAATTQPAATVLESPIASAAPSPAASPAPGGSAAASVCRETEETGVVAVAIADFAFRPSAIAAKVGQVVTFGNAGFEPHNATVAAGCATRTLQTGESDGLVFSVPGNYPFACMVHAWMTGTFTIAP